MLSDIEKLLSKDFEEITNSSLSLLLLDCYSKLYLNGGQPRYCRASQLLYYQEISKTGKIMAEKFDEINKRTFNLKLDKGIMYVGKPFCRHFNRELMSDANAIALLKNGILKESDFTTLPAGFKDPAPKQIPVTEQAPAKPKAPKKQKR
jgi:hypothetical protein